MPSLIDIRRRIRSVKNTQQITKAMKMVSAAKLRRAQERTIASRPYGGMLRKVLANVAAAAAGDERAAANPLLARREENRVLLVLVTGDKGLAGAFNTNLIKSAQRFVIERKGAKVRLELIGRKGRDFFRKRDFDITGDHIGLAAKARYDDISVIAQKAMEMFKNEEIDAVYLLYNEFKSVASQKADAFARTARRIAGADDARGLHLRRAARGDAGGFAAALRGDGILPGALGIHRQRACRAHDRDGRGHFQRRRYDRTADLVHEPRAPGQHHQGNYRSGERRRRRRIRNLWQPVLELK
jgi:hypothetical protein